MFRSGIYSCLGSVGSRSTRKEYYGADGEKESRVAGEGRYINRTSETPIRYMPYNDNVDSLLFFLRSLLASFKKTLGRREQKANEKFFAQRFS